MTILSLLAQEFENEYQITRQFIEKFPSDHPTYKPHEKSMELKFLANHIVEIFGWPEFMLNTEKLDFDAGDYQPSDISSKDELLTKLEDEYKKGLERINSAQEEELTLRWKLTSGEIVFADYTKYEAIRHALNQITHHRAQLGVYYRLLDIELPSSYGPSADTQTF